MFEVNVEGKVLQFPYKPVLVCYRGSHSFGTHTPPDDGGLSDIDLLGICAPPLDHYFGSKNWEGKDWWDENYDIVTYSFKKFVHLLTKGNPNCIGTLWTKDEHFFETSWLSERLIASKEIFLAKKTVVASFKGYAAGQMHKMTHFYDSSFYQELDDLAGQLKELGIYGMNHNEAPMEHRALIAQHNKLKKKLYQGYMGEKRRALVDEFGYDTKNASHLLRLLTMCVEILDTCQINVYREHDAQTYIDIKKGKWTLDAVSERAEELFAEIRDKYDACPLPEEPDYDKINKLSSLWLYNYFTEQSELFYEE